MRGHPGPTQSLPWGPGVRARSALSHPASDPAPRPGLPCSPPGLSPWLLLLCCQMKTNPEADGETLVQEKAPCGGSAAVSETPQRLAPARKRERGVPGPRGDAGQAGGAERGPTSKRPAAASGFQFPGGAGTGTRLALFALAPAGPVGKTEPDEIASRPGRRVGARRVAGSPAHASHRGAQSPSRWLAGGTNETPGASAGSTPGGWT